MIDTDSDTAVIALTNTIGLQISVSYCIDSYRELAGESIVTVILIRNTMSFAIGYGVTPWVSLSRKTTQSVL